MCIRQAIAIGGSGSTYLYGYCDANYKAGMTKDQTIDFVKNAVSLAISRDGSSGGVIRIAAINEDGVQRLLYTGNDIPAFNTDM
jgi:20S proteasome subunit beta 1